MSREQTASPFASRATGENELDALVREHDAHPVVEQGYC
jgi:hypothetical protein